MDTFVSLSSLFPLTSPIPNAKSIPELLNSNHILTEHDLSRNPDQPTRWNNYILTISEEVLASELLSRGKATELELEILGKKLSTQSGRFGLQRLTDVYERVLFQYPKSFKLWKEYLAMRSSYVLGTPELPLKLSAPKRKKSEDGVGRTMTEWLEAGKGEIEELQEGERDIESGWVGGLDGIVGWEEWRSLAAVHERALMWLPNMPRLWLSYLSMFTHPLCPSALSHTHARKTFDRALRSLPPSLHERIWHVYLAWASKVGGETCIKVFRRYLKVDDTPSYHYVQLLLNLSPTPKPLEASKILLNLSRKVANGSYKSPEGKSSYQLLGEWLEVCEKYPEETGIDEEASAILRQKRERDEVAKAEEDAASAATNASNGAVVVPVPAQKGAGKRGGPSNNKVVLALEDTTSRTLLDVEGIVRTEGIKVYKDQAGRLWTGLATYWIKRGEFDLARQTFEEGIKTVLTLRDFTQIFDAYAEFSESYMSSLMESLAEDDDEDKADDEKEVDLRMQEFEELMDRRPFLVNEVLLRRNPNDVQEWEKRVALYGTDDIKVAETYTKATSTIAPRKATGYFHTLWVHFAKFYESGGVSGEAESDIDSARKIFEKAVKVPFKKVDELAEVWCEWAEMEVRNENYDEAIKVMQRASQIPRKTGVSFHDESVPVQARLFKCLKLWSFYVDLEESIGSIVTTKAVYDKIFELKIANAQIVINFANFLEENEYWEDSFKVYERGVDLFTYPVAFEIWNTYLSKFIKRYGGDKIERARDLFEQALEKCPAKFAKPLFLLYGQLEEEHGLAKRAMGVYDRATMAVEPTDRMEMFTYYIAKATANFGLPATRPIYERALEALPDKQTAEMCLRFAALERKLGEIDRARAIFAHASQFCDPRSNPDFWATWNSFEIETGSEDTFREYLRIKRAVQSAFNTEASYLSAKLSAVKAGGIAAEEAVNGGVDIDPMSALENALKPAFVAAKGKSTLTGEQPAPVVGNADEITMDDDSDDE